MELRDYLTILRRRGWLIILLAVLTAVSAYGYSATRVPIYTSTVRLLITSRPDFGQTQAAKALLRDYAAWLRSSYRAEDVIDALQLDTTPSALLANTAVAASSSESIITVEVEHPIGERANDIARIWANQLIEWRQQENAGLRKEDRIEAIILDNPQYGAPSPNVRVNTAAGAVFGALLGVIVIFLLEWIESGVVRRNEDVERFLDIPVIGSIPNQ